MRDSHGVKVSTTCHMLRDHEIICNGPNGGYYRDQWKLAGSGKGYFLRYYYWGELHYCARQGCHYQLFRGDTDPFKVTKIVDGQEVETVYERQSQQKSA